MARFAAVQMTSSLAIGPNLMQAKSILRGAKDKGADFILLPEHFAGFPEHTSGFLAMAESFGQGRIQSFLKEQSSQLGLYLAANVPLISGEKITQSLLVWDEEGECVARYDRIHLYPGKASKSLGVLGEEPQHIEAGNPDQLAVLSTPFGKVGLSIGFDLRFPGHFERLRKQGAEIILVPGSFSYALGDAHWPVLLGARAIEQQVFLVAANQYGLHDNGQESFGSSLVLDPWGDVLDWFEHGVGFAIADLSLIQLQVQREEFLQ